MGNCSHKVIHTINCQKNTIHWEIVLRNGTVARLKTTVSATFQIKPELLITCSQRTIRHCGDRNHSGQATECLSTNIFAESNVSLQPSTLTHSRPAAASHGEKLSEEKRNSVTKKPLTSKIQDKLKACACPVCPGLPLNHMSDCSPILSSPLRLSSPPHPSSSLLFSSIVFPCSPLFPLLHSLPLSSHLLSLPPHSLLPLSSPLLASRLLSPPLRSWLLLSSPLHGLWVAADRSIDCYGASSPPPPYKKNPFLVDNT